jgi:diacylglycerol kinase (ATP)
MPISIIINPVSGGARPEQARRRAELAAAVTAAHHEDCEIFITERRGHARELAAGAAARGARLVIAWGGDGTLNEVASALAFTQTPVGIVAAGSGNGLAIELGVPRRAERAIAQAIAAKPRPIDLGELDGHLFVNLAGIGFDAELAARFDERGHRVRGLIGYVLAGVPLIASYAPVDYRVDADGQRRDVRAVMVTIANGRQFGNGARIAPDARFDDGVLDLVIVEEASRLQTLRHMPKLMTGGVERAPGCSIRRVRHVVLESEAEMRYHVDGEPFAGGSRLEARIHPGALRVCA